VFAEKAPHRVTIHGELVHNETVNERLRQLGFVTRPEDDRERPPETPDVLITAHGISDAERARLAATGARLVDTTCPLVRRAHRAATQFAAEGRFVVVIGNAGHVEVRGLTGDLSRVAVVRREEDVERYDAARIGVVCQTTFRVDEAEAIVEAVRRANPDADVR